jgi:hypothetical protein
MVLGVLNDPFKSPLLRVVLKCGMLFASFQDCATVCQGAPSKCAEGQVFWGFIPCKGMSREDLIKSQIAGVSFAETFSDNSDQNNLKRNCRI